MACVKWGSRQKSVLVVGSLSSGKTTLVKTMAGTNDDKTPTVPTLGLRKETVNCLHGHKVVIYEIGGTEALRADWPVMFGEVQGVIYAIDVTDVRNSSDTKERLSETIEHPDIKRKPFLIVGTKIDAEYTMTEDLFFAIYELDALLSENENIRVVFAEESINPRKGFNEECQRTTQEYNALSGWRNTFSIASNTVEVMNLTEGSKWMLDFISENQNELKGRVIAARRSSNKSLKRELKNIQKLWEAHLTKQEKDKRKATKLPSVIVEWEPKRVETSGTSSLLTRRDSYEIIMQRNTKRIAQSGQSFQTGQLQSSELSGQSERIGIDKGCQGSDSGDEILERERSSERSKRRTNFSAKVSIIS